MPRRSISTSGELYAIVRAYCKERGVSVSSYMAVALVRALRDDGVSLPASVVAADLRVFDVAKHGVRIRERRAAQEKLEEVRRIASNHFTF